MIIFVVVGLLKLIEAVVTAEYSIHDLEVLGSNTVIIILDGSRRTTLKYAQNRGPAERHQ